MRINLADSDYEPDPTATEFAYGDRFRAEIALWNRFLKLAGLPPLARDLTPANYRVAVAALLSTKDSDESQGGESATLPPPSGMNLANVPAYVSPEHRFDLENLLTATRIAALRSRFCKN